MTDAATLPRKDMPREELIAALRSLRPVFERDGVTRMALFGSRARRDNRPHSDAELAIEVDESRKFSLLDLIGVEHAIEDSIGIQANIVMRRSLRPEFLSELRRDGVDIF